MGVFQGRSSSIIYSFYKQSAKGKTLHVRDARAQGNAVRFVRTRDVARAHQRGIDGGVCLRLRTSAYTLGTEVEQFESILRRLL